VTVAKALGNGLPIGGFLARGTAAEALQPGDHGSTFGGGPAVCAAARATLAALAAQGLGANAVDAGAYLREQLVELGDRTGTLSDVRGAGLMIGVTLTRPIAADVATIGLDRGLVLNNIGTDILRFLPPLVCGKPEIDTLLSTLTDILAEVNAE
jgi:acetylornithine/succinyldiaminopimelate/putrescine aminotransferase